MLRSILPLLFYAALGLAPARADLIFAGTMLGSNEVPPTGSTATGFTTVDILGDLMTVDVSWSGLIGGTAAAAHIHCCVPIGTNVGVAVGFTGFPAATSGTYHNTFDLTNSSIYTASFLSAFGGGTAAGAEAALIAGLEANQAYSNIHDTQFGGGEIRANLTQVPEPSMGVMVAAGMIGLILWRRRASFVTR